jgi:predicted GNAT family acetyltransferase
MLKIYSEPRLFWREVSPDLRREEAKNNLLLGLAHQFVSDPMNCLYQVACFSEERLTAALICNRQRQVQNFVPSPIQDEQSARQIFAAFSQSGLSVAGMMGEAQSVGLYQQLFQELGYKTRIHAHQGIYRCKYVRALEPHRAVKFRPARIADVQELGRWISLFHREVFPSEPPVDGLEIATAKIRSETLFVLEKSGQLLAMAGCNRDIETSCSIALVYTPKRFRKRGYASLVTAKLTQLMLDRGKVETNLFTDLANPTSNKIYQAIGYEWVCNSIHLQVLRE